MGKDRKGPAFDHALARVVHKELVKVGGTESFNFRLDEALTKGIAKAHFEHMTAPRKHLAHELVASQPEQRVLGVVMPALTTAKAEPFEAALVGGLNTFLILRFAGLDGDIRDNSLI